ncbi:hypothetical protein L6452_28747 [Arctium lappa]|uniref:Uncharacterized protein n=1 Tax=Arctium lappa TaxID=4217 RepID=A0ACB9A0N8_ARCLA|nr:hypothetical protein L6452_28747 [Arctium lappa]
MAYLRMKLSLLDDRKKKKTPGRDRRATGTNLLRKALAADRKHLKLWRNMLAVRAAGVLPAAGDDVEI